MAATTGMLTCRRLAFAPAAALRPIRCSAPRPAVLQSQFLRPACSLHSLCSSFGGMRLSSAPSFQSAPPSSRGMRLITTAGNCMGNTKGGTRRARTRTSGYRARRLTPGGRHVLRNRRKKGRKILTPASNYKK